MASQGGKLKRIAIVGHSHVRRLQNVIDSESVSFPFDDAQIRFFHKGGLRVPQIFARDFLCPLLEFNPHAIYLCIGDNDLNPHTSPDNVCHYIMSAIDSIRQMCPSLQSIAIGQVLPRHPGTSIYWFEEYDGMALTLNRLLAQACQSSPVPVKFCWYKDFPFNGENGGVKYNNNKKLFLKDGVHLTDDGYSKLARNFKGLIKGLKDKIIL